MTRLSRGNYKTAKSTPTKTETTKRTTTETTLSNNNHTSPYQLSINSKKKLFEKQQEDIDYLVKKVRCLDGKISELGCFFVTQQVNSLLEEKIDCQEQYSWLLWLAISRMKEPGDKKNNSNEVAKTLARESDNTKDPSHW